MLRLPPLPNWDRMVEMISGVNIFRSKKASESVLALCGFLFYPFTVFLFLLLFLNFVTVHASAKLPLGFCHWPSRQAPQSEYCGTVAQSWEVLWWLHCLWRELGWWPERCGLGLNPWTSTAVVAMTNELQLINNSVYLLRVQLFCGTRRKGNFSPGIGSHSIPS